MYYEAIGSASIPLEDVLETELDNARVDRCGIDLPERAIPQRSVGISELRMIEGIVKLRPELEGMPFFYHRVFDNRNIPVKLTGTTSNTNAGIAPAPAIAIDPTGWGRAERAFVDVAGATACTSLSRILPDVGMEAWVAPSHICALPPLAP